jgi:Protein of unknown function (DUF2846).
MKKQLLFWVMLIGFIPVIYGSDSILGKVVFYREKNYFGSAVSYRVQSGDSLICWLKNNSFYELECKPGDYKFRINNPNSPEMQLNVQSGKTYYLRFDLSMGMWSSTTQLILVDSLSAYPKIHNGQMRELLRQTSVSAIKKDRLGIILNMGVGFQNTGMMTNSLGGQSKISFGGGYGMGLRYGHEFTKHFDLAFELNYQESELTPRLTNASMAFGRGTISITPSYVFPIKGGETMRIKLGGGIDGYFGSQLRFDFSKISGGFKDNWNYKGAIGYHFLAIYEMNLSESWSLDYGLKYYGVNYNFEKGQFTLPTDKRLSTPNGSGIDLTVGVYYHF